MSTVRVLAGIVGATLVGLAGCGQVIGGGDDDRGWEARFADLPAPVDEFLLLTAIDLDLAAEVAEIGPGDLAGLAEASLQHPVAAAFPTVLDPQTIMVEGFEEATGFDRSDVRWVAEIDQTPALAATLGIDVDLDGLEAVNGPAQDGVIEGPDPFMQDLDARAPGRPLGRQPRHDLWDDRMMLSRWQEDPTEGARLTDVEAFRALLAAFDELQFYTGHALQRPQPEGDVPPPDGSPVPDEIALSTLPERYRIVALGFPVPEDDQVTAAMVFVHEGSAPAEANADALGAVLTEGSPLRGERDWEQLVSDVEVTRDDTVVIARFSLVDDLPPNVLLRALHTDGLVPHRG